MTSACPQKEICGSCGWSHIPYPKQLEQKLSDINGSFKLKELSYQCTEISPSPKTSHYRNRMDFVIGFDGKIGLREKGKWWKVIDNHSCFISDEHIDRLFQTTRQWAHNSKLSYYDRKSFKGLLRYAVIRCTSKSETMINIVTSLAQQDEEALLQEQLYKLAKETAATTLIHSTNTTITDVSNGDILKTISGNGYIEEIVGGYTYRITPNAFFQTNSNAAGILLELVKNYAGDLTDKKLLDLYCGSGFFSIALARQAKQAFGVELSTEMIEQARNNAEINNVKVEYWDAKAESFDWEKLGADVVILDPPRSGMHDQALKDVLRIKPKKIVYVSCNYKSFAREMLELSKLYDLTKMQAVDMFPHTPHVELVSLLELKA